MLSSARLPRVSTALAGTALGLGAAGIAASAAHAHATESQSYTVTAWYLNVRSAPTDASARVDLLEKGDVVHGKPLDNGWVQIDGGYVHGYWLEANEADPTPEPPTPEPPTPGEATFEVTTYLNVRAEATARSSIVGLYTPGTQVAGTKLDNGWVQTADGFVHGAYVKQVDEAPTPPTPEPDPAPGDTYRIDRSVNLRSGPGMRYQVIGVAPRGAEVTGTDVNGWVHTDLGYFWHTFATKVEDGPEDPAPEPPTPPTPPTPEPPTPPTPEPPTTEVIRYVDPAGGAQFTGVYAGPSYGSGYKGSVAEGYVLRGNFTADGQWFQAGPTSFVPVAHLTDVHYAYTGTNGRLDPNTLCDNPIPGQEHQLLQCDAVAPLAGLNKEFKNTFGHDLKLGECYRTYETQVLYKIRRGFWAATPGTSQHGWAAACDLSEPESEVGFGTAKYNWLDANAPRFGWENPSWARQGAYKPEYWHWEFASLTQYSKSLGALGD